jgi:hypothetical protein
MHEEPYFWFLPESDGFSSKGFSPDRRFVLSAAFRAVHPLHRHWFFRAENPLFCEK